MFLKMHSLRPIYILSALNKHVLRTITTTNQAVDVKESVPLKSWREIPGPKRFLMIIGTLRQLFPGGQLKNMDGYTLTNMLYKAYGPIIRLDGIFGRDPLIFLFDAESSSQILRGENWLPVRPGFKSLEHYRENFKKGRKAGKPSGLITDHGEIWRELRTTVNPVLLQPKTIRLYATVLDEVAMDMIERLKSIKDENNMIKENFDHEMNKWALESIGVVALGCRLNCLDPDLPDNSPVKKLIQCVHDIFVAAAKLDLNPSVWKYYTTPTFKTAMKLYEDQETLSKFFIDKAIKEFETNTKTDDEKGILEKLLEINEDFAYIMASDMLFAGVDTTANSIIGALYLLAINPEKQNKLREELQSNDKRKPYLKACMKEAIRMMPIASGNVRLTTKEYNILGYKIPSGISIAFGHQNMSLMEEYFPRAKEFLPERWIADKNDPLFYRNAHPFAYNPFGFGARSCIGRRIAELEMETFLGRMVENFYIEWVGDPPKVVQTSLNYVKGPYNFVFKDVKNDL